MKYVAMIDYKAGKNRDGFAYIELTANDLVAAIEQADDLWSNDVYLIKIMEKTGKVNRFEGFRVVTFKSVLCRRSHGWHPTKEKYAESETIIKQYTNKYFTSYEIA